jgi:hypothetical protein
MHVWVDAVHEGQVYTLESHPIHSTWLTAITKRNWTRRDRCECESVADVADMAADGSGRRTYFSDRSWGHVSGQQWISAWKFMPTPALDEERATWNAECGLTRKNALAKKV